MSSNLNIAAVIVTPSPRELYTHGLHEAIASYETLTQNDSIYFRRLYRHSRASGNSGSKSRRLPRPPP